MPGTALVPGNVEHTKQRLFLLKHMFHWASSEAVKTTSKQTYTVSGSYRSSEEEVGVERDSVCRGRAGESLSDEGIFGKNRVSKEMKEQTHFHVFPSCVVQTQSLSDVEPLPRRAVCANGSAFSQSPASAPAP